MNVEDLQKWTVLKAKEGKIIVQPKDQLFVVSDRYFDFMRIETGYLELPIPVHGVMVSFSKDREHWSDALPRSVAWILENYEKIIPKPTHKRNRLEEVEE